MNDVQVFQLFGLVLFAAGLGMLSHPAYYRRLLLELKNSPTGMFFVGLLAVAVGYFLIAFRGLWGSGWSLMVVMLGWIALFKGFWVLTFPAHTLSLARYFGRKTNFDSVATWFLILSGILFLYLGFFLL